MSNEAFLGLMALGNLRITYDKQDEQYRKTS